MNGNVLVRLVGEKTEVVKAERIVIQYKDDLHGYDQVCWIGDSREEAESWLEENYSDYHYSDSLGLPRSIDDVTGLWMILTNRDLDGEAGNDVYYYTEYALRDGVLFKKSWR